MPTKRKTTLAAETFARRTEHLRPISKQLIKELFGESGPKPLDAQEISELTLEFRRALVESALQGELSHHLGYAPGEERPSTSSNARNGKSGKTVLTDSGALRVDIPRDRAGSFEPILIPKHERRLSGFDDKIIALYARGMSVREIQGFVREQYDTEVSADFISSVTDAVLGEVHAWQTRPLDPMIPVVFFDALRVKIRDEAVVSNRAVYLALAILPDGSRDILGIWVEQNEGAKFWLKVFNDLKNRGLEDILIAVTDGLKGMPEALESAYPKTTLQTCIVHLIRNSLEFANWKDRKPLAARLRAIYTAINEPAAKAALDEFEASAWGQKYPSVVALWRRAWERVIPFFAFSPEVRKIIYTTNAIESVNAQLRKIIKTRGHFPSDEAATKLIWLALRNITAKWNKSVLHWKAAMNQFAIAYPQRFMNQHPKTI